MDGLSVPAHGFKLLCGTANRPLAEEMARYIGVDLARVTLSRFADGEIFVRIDENVRGNDVFIIQPTNPPAENILEMWNPPPRCHDSACRPIRSGSSGAGA